MPIVVSSARAGTVCVDMDGDGTAETCVEIDHDGASFPSEDAPGHLGAYLVAARRQLVGDRPFGEGLARLN